MQKIIFGKEVKIKGMGKIPAGTECSVENPVVSIRVNNAHMAGTAYINAMPYVANGDAHIANCVDTVAAKCS